MRVKVYHNGDDVFIAWKPAAFIPKGRGFALLRRRNGVEEVVSTWVGFVGEQHKEGERRASTNWPIQKYQWTDYMANPGDKVQSYQGELVNKAEYTRAFFRHVQDNSYDTTKLSYLWRFLLSSCVN